VGGNLVVKQQLSSHLARAKGMGATGHGTDHFIHQRFTALGLIPLSVWLIVQLVILSDHSYQQILEWFQQPVNNILLILFLMLGIYHCQLGLQMIIEDYVSVFWIKLTCIMMNNFSAIALLTACVYGVLSLAWMPHNS